MTYMLIIVSQSLEVFCLRDPVQFPLRLDGRLFRNDPPPAEPVFYDWIVDLSGEIEALEVHLSSDDPYMRSAVPLSSVPAIELRPFVRFWLTARRGGIPLGLEAFDDLSFAHSADGQLALLVGLDNWLPQALVERLIAHWPEKAWSE